MLFELLIQEVKAQESNDGLAFVDKSIINGTHGMKSESAHLDAIVDPSKKCRACSSPPQPFTQLASSYTGGRAKPKRCDL